MSIRLLQSIVSSVRKSFPRNTDVNRTAIQIRLLTMPNASAETPMENRNNMVMHKNKTRYKQRILKRQWEEVNPKSTDSGVSEEKRICDKPFERIKRKKMAVLLGYSGVNYYGMQRNPGVPTIEEELLKALLDAKYITEEDFVNQQNAQFQRSSRTDKGVSAARQVVSLKLPLETKIEEINSRLPSCIKVFGIKRVTNRFNSKSKCNARTYSYTLPTHVFEPSIEREEDKKAYRITAEKTTKVNEVLAMYKGTKSYHNFTEKKHYHDPSALRYMMGFTLERVFMESEMEFAELLVKGQSFMLHQIRKMVGLMIAVVRGYTDMSIVEKAFGKEKVMIPTAPGLGLVLDKVHYESYDAKYKSSHDSLTWDDAEEAILKFKHEQIYPSILKGEIEDNSMGLWLQKLKRHSYEPSDDVPEEKTDEILYDDDDDDDDDDDCDDDSNKKILNIKKTDNDNINKNEVSNTEKLNEETNKSCEGNVGLKVDGDENIKSENVSNISGNDDNIKDKDNNDELSKDDNSKMRI